MLKQSKNAAASAERADRRATQVETQMNALLAGQRNGAPAPEAGPSGKRSGKRGAKPKPTRGAVRSPSASARPSPSSPVPGTAVDADLPLDATIDLAGELTRDSDDDSRADYAVIRAAS